jgi:hypothetical protein
MEMCVNYGWCDVKYQADAFRDLVRSGVDADGLVDAILPAEGASLFSGAREEYLRLVVKDWLFDAEGHGAVSGLPLV